MKWLNEQNLINGRSLDYGCGKGFDAEALNMVGYDPYYAPDTLKGNFDTITCNYVLNVLDDLDTVFVALMTIRGRLEIEGTAYITVRRDKMAEGYTTRGFQATVILNLESIRKTPRYEIYKLTKNTPLLWDTVDWKYLEDDKTRKTTCLKT